MAGFKTKVTPEIENLTEVGDGTLECRDIPHTIQMLELFLQDDTFLSDMCQNIVTNKKAGLYDGAYKVVELAMGLKNKKK